MPENPHIQDMIEAEAQDLMLLPSMIHIIDHHTCHYEGDNIEVFMFEYPAPASDVLPTRRKIVVWANGTRATDSVIPRY